jgi:hypothetical protein
VPLGTPANKAYYAELAGARVVHRRADARMLAR